MRTWRDWAVFGAGLIIAGWFFVQAYQVHLRAQADRVILCDAVKETIVQESRLILRVMEFPSSHTTDRWKSLMGGC